MAFKKQVLVVANVTASSDELRRTLLERAQRGSTAFTLLIPATGAGGGRAAAKQTLEQALAGLREAGLEVDGSVGDVDPLVAVREAWDPATYDEIIVSTLPMKFSKWLRAGLPERIFKLTDAPVTHVVSQPPTAVAPTQTQPPDHKAPLGPLSVLGWGASRDPER